MTEKGTNGEPGPGLQGQTSGEGGIRAGDASVATDKQPYEPAGEGGLAGIEALDGETARTLVAVARAMYPHDRVPDLHYERIVASLDEKAAGDEKTRVLLTEGVQSLSTLTGRWPHEFAGLDEADQVNALQRIEHGPFFKAVAAEIVVGLYSQPDIWPYFGYEGPSNDKGGYVDRGFDDIDWLDDAPDYRGHRIEKTYTDSLDHEITEQDISKED